MEEKQQRAQTGGITLPLIDGTPLIEWDQFRHLRRRERDYSGFGPYTFDRKQYETVLEKLAELG